MAFNLPLNTGRGDASRLFEPRDPRPLAKRLDE